MMKFLSRPFTFQAVSKTIYHLMRGCWNAFRNVRRESAPIAFQRGSATRQHLILVLIASSSCYALQFALLMLTYEWQIARLLSTYTMDLARPLIAFATAIISYPAITLFACWASWRWVTRLAGQRGSRIEHNYWIAGLWAIGSNLGILLTVFAWIVGLGLLGILASVGIAVYTVVIGGFGFKVMYPFKDREPPFVAAGITVLIGWFTLYVLQTILT
ncbi:MAG: hypothetical protein J0M33_26535 [Anaerolineae bacterium]|nr:hypothetical protein [Anaerolineae bacterium]